MKGNVDQGTLLASQPAAGRVVVMTCPSQLSSEITRYPIVIFRTPD